MVGGRLGGRYLVCNARGKMGMAVISMMVMYELFYEAGFTITWWQKMIILLGIGIVNTVWFLWGGITDLHELYVDLKTYKSDASDDGTVQLAYEQVLPDNYVDFVEAESDNQYEPKPYPIQANSQKWINFKQYWYRWVNI